MNTLVDCDQEYFGVRALLHELYLLSFRSSSDAREIFMTLTPQVPGRMARTTRPGLAEGMEFLPDTAPWFQLLSVTQKINHLYLATVELQTITAFASRNVQKCTVCQRASA